jgi:hypothetical protein
MDDPLVCPACAREYPSGERFCAQCGTPLVYAQASEQTPAQPTARQRRARKIKPQYTEGKLVKAAHARNQTEAEFLQGLLLEEGVPSMLRRSAGFDVPDFLAAGPRDVMVPLSGLQTAHEVLLQSELIPPAAQQPLAARPWLVMAWLLAALAIVALVALLHP